MPFQVSVLYYKRLTNKLTKHLCIELALSLEELKQDWLHPLLWKLLRNDLGLYTKIKIFLKRHGNLVAHENMFLLAPDSKTL